MLKNFFNRHAEGLSYGAAIFGTALGSAKLGAVAGTPVGLTVPGAVIGGLAGAFTSASMIYNLKKAQGRHAAALAVKRPRATGPRHHI